MEFEALMVSLATLTALAVVAGLAWTLRLDYDDSAQLASDIFRVMRLRGCIVRAYYLEKVRVSPWEVDLPSYVIWGSNVTSKIRVRVVADRREYSGFVILRICYNGTHLTIVSNG